MTSIANCRAPYHHRSNPLPPFLFPLHSSTCPASATCPHSPLKPTIIPPAPNIAAHSLPHPFSDCSTHNHSLIAAMDSHRESHHRHENVSYSSLNGDSEPSETYHKVHHDLDSAAAKRKPIVTESNYKVTTAEPAVEDRPAHVTKTNVSKTTTTSSNQKSSSNNQKKGQFISKPEYENQRDNDDEDDDDSGAGAWIPLLGGAAAIAALIGGLFYYKKKNPDVDQKFRRSVEDADHRVKGALGTGERRVKEFLGSGQQRLKNLVGRTAEHIDNDSDDDEHHGFGNNGLYKVKKGDNMAKIAQKTGNKSWHEIAEKNPRFRNPNLIYPGDELRV